MRHAHLAAADADARLVAQTELDRPVVLEAGAGTGKTAALVARVAAWCLGRGWEEAAAATEGDEQVAAQVLDGVVAITFTEAAAAEMAARVGTAMAALAAGELPAGVAAAALPSAERRRTRAAALLTCLDRLTVTTIHAYCRRLLATYPIDAGLHPLFTVDADGTAVDEAAAEVVERGLAAGMGGSPDAMVLAASGIGPEALARSLAATSRRCLPAAALATERFTTAALAAVRADLDGALAAFAAAAPGLRGVSRAPGTGATLARLDAVAARVAALGPDLGAWEELAEELREDLQGGALKRVREWARGELVQAEEAALEDRGAAVRAAGALERALRRVSDLRPRTFEAARRLLHPLLAELERLLHARGVVSFEGLLVHAVRLLSRPAVRARVRAGLRQLLVDEFQDTDRLQCRLVADLALDGEGGPGLLVVGDPKQSIYGWRNAELEAYEAFVARVESAGGRRCALSVNFRSAPAILDEVERLLVPVMRAVPGRQPPFEPLVACPALAEDPGFAAGDRAPVEHWVCRPRPEEPGDRRVADALPLETEAIARDMRAVHDDHGVPWPEMALLLRTGSDLPEYLRALQEAGVPYAVEHDRSYYRRREVIDAVALVRTVFDPGDHLAMLTTLRSAAVGVPDAALLPLWGRGFPGLVTELEGVDEARLARLEEVVHGAAAVLSPAIPGLAELAGWDEALLAFLRALAGLRAAAATDPVDVVVEKIRAATMLEACEGARYLGAYRAANLDRFFRRLADELDAGADPHAALARLRAAVAEGREEEEATPPDAAAEAVRVLTVHRAKGLGFAHVYLGQLHKRSRGETMPLEDAQDTPGGWEVVLCGAPSPGWAAVQARRTDVAAHELVRTLYVATTRAKQRLVLAAAWSPSGSGAPGSHGDLLAARQPAPPSFADAARALAGGGCWVDDGGARWVFPALATAALRPAQAADTRTVDPAALALLLRQGADRRAAAAARQALPWRGAASAPAHRLLADGDAGSPPAGAGAALAMALGSAVHRAFELARLGADPAAELARARSAAQAELAEAIPEAQRAEGRARLDALLDRLGAGSLWPRLLALRERVVARELPLLLPPRPGAEVGFVAGALDLLYRDEAGELVVADFKTDAPEDPLELERRVEAYRLQLAAYARAVETALRLAAPPRCELWFVALDRVVAVEPQPTG